MHYYNSAETEHKELLVLINMERTDVSFRYQREEIGALLLIHNPSLMMLIFQE